MNSIFEELVCPAARRVPTDVLRKSSRIDDHDVAVHLRDRKLRADILIILDQLLWGQTTLVDVCNQDDRKRGITYPSSDA